ncbi:MAG: hypothetical protein Q7T54_00690 [Candidatus Levybacteria bacterium]|nr:hypothetical protein [Candidatus Levybacteria bacterium]
MKYLLHGDDITTSRKYLSELLEGTKLSIFDGKSVAITTLEESLLSRGLFSEKKAVVVENLLSRSSKKKEFISFLNTASSETLLVLWEDKKLLKTTTNSLKNINIQEFALPTYYFQFLDTLVPSQKKQVFGLYQELLKTYAPEQLLFSLLKRVRLLVVLASGGETSEIAKMPPWMKSKLERQGKMWTKNSLLLFYKKLQDAEIKLKTGKLPVDLSKHLDILILSHL